MEKFIQRNKNKFVRRPYKHLTQHPRVTTQLDKAFSYLKPFNFSVFAPFHTVYKINKNNIFSSFFYLQEVYSLRNFTRKIKDLKLLDNHVYTVFVKVRYNVYNFLLVGNKFAYKPNKDSTKDINDIIKMRLDEYLSRYSLDHSDIMYIQVIFRLLDKKFLSDLILNNNKTITKKENR